MYITDKYEVNEINDELLLVPKQHIGENNALIFNKLATQIYQMIEVGYNTNDISKIIQEKYAVDEREVLQDINDVMALLIEYGVVER